MDPGSASIAGGFNMDAGSLCSPQGDSEAIKHERNAKDASSWVCHATACWQRVWKQKRERSESFLLLARNPQTMTEDGPQTVSLRICQIYWNNILKPFFFL